MRERNEKKKQKKWHERERDKRTAAATAVASEGAVARDETREGSVEEAEDRDVNHNM